MPPPSVENNAAHHPVAWQPGLFLTLILCLFGAAAGGAVVHRLHPLFPREDLPPIGLGASAELVQQHRNAEFEYRSKNYGLELGIIGLGFGVALSAISKSPNRVAAILVGASVGALIGAVLGFSGGRMVANAIFQNQQQTLTESIGLQAGVWGLMLGGIVWSSAAIHVGLTRATSYGLLGFFAGVLVASTQFVISSLLFPASNPLFLVPEETQERFYWTLAFLVVSGPVLAFGLSRRRPDSSPNAFGK